ncbi:hypothetical protein Tco_0077641, partial [Tanacetum coccineum]
AALIRLDTSSSILPNLCSIDTRYQKDSLGCRILSPIQISTSSLWAIFPLPKSHLSLMFKPSAKSKTSTKLHGVTEKLDTPIIAANLRITFVFEDWNDFTKSPLFRHLRASEDLVEKAS